jgi:hypothetical protein
MKENYFFDIENADFEINRSSLTSTLKYFDEIKNLFSSNYFKDIFGTIY